MTLKITSGRGFLALNHKRDQVDAPHLAGAISFDLPYGSRRLQLKASAWRRHEEGRLFYRVMVQGMTGLLTRLSSGTGITRADYLGTLTASETLEIIAWDRRGRSGRTYIELRVSVPVVPFDWIRP